MIIINVENCRIFLWKRRDILFFRILWWIESSKEQHLFEIEILCDIINVFTVTFDQCNASLLHKSQNLTDPKHLNASVAGLLCFGLLKGFLVSWVTDKELSLSLFIFIVPQRLFWLESSVCLEIHTRPQRTWRRRSVIKWAITGRNWTKLRICWGTRTTKPNRPRDWLLTTYWTSTVCRCTLTQTQTYCIKRSESKVFCYVWAGKEGCGRWTEKGNGGNFGGRREDAGRS